jgi:hypothetical protein
VGFVVYLAERLPGLEAVLGAVIVGARDGQPAWCFVARAGVLEVRVARPGAANVTHTKETHRRPPGKNAVGNIRPAKKAIVTAQAHIQALEPARSTSLIAQ